MQPIPVRDAAPKGLTIGGMPFERMPAGPVEIGDRELGHTLRTEHVKGFAMARTPAPNWAYDQYSARMGNVTHGLVARRKIDGRPFVIARCEEGGKNIQFRLPRTAGEIALGTGGNLLRAQLVRLVPDKDRYVKNLGEEKAKHFIGPNLPGSIVTPLETLGLADILAHETGIDMGLPTTTQWEHAAKAGQNLRYSPRGELDPSAVIYNHDGKREGPAPIDRPGIVPNPFGLVDMTGNVWEPTLFEGPTKTDIFRVVWRGGTWVNNDKPGLLVSFDELIRDPDFAGQLNGGRVVAFVED